MGSWQFSPDRIAKYKIENGGNIMLVNKIGNIGTIVATKKLIYDMETNKRMEKDVFKALDKYLSCDWGVLCDEDKEMNDLAVANPKSDRILARYKTCKGDIYIITEWDRSYTTLMYCEEY